jgi:hypothetical protein
MNNALFTPDASELLRALCEVESADHIRALEHMTQPVSANTNPAPQAAPRNPEAAPSIRRARRNEWRARRLRVIELV